MGTGATDMAHIRAEGTAVLRHRSRASTARTAQKGFGAHSDQERILVAELHRFVRFQYDVVMELARAK